MLKELGGGMKDWDQGKKESRFRVQNTIMSEKH